jgi:flagellar hook assembly protein FlgD
VLNSRTKADAKDWSLEIVNKTDEVVRRFGGSGQTPAHIQWDGKDETGLPLADGSYRYHLVVNDREGRRIVGPTRAVEISTTGPQGQVPVVQAQEPPKEPQ